MSTITLFSQIISKLVKDKETDKHNKGYTSWTHLVSMLFCQFAKSQSVRDISNGLRSATVDLNQLGIAKAPSKFNYQLSEKAPAVVSFQGLLFFALGKFRTAGAKYLAC